MIGEGPDLDATVVGVELAAEPPSELPPLDLWAEALALLVYTSGTTGSPKAVMLDHANVAARCDMTRAALGITAADHRLLIPPLFHVTASSWAR